MPRFLKSRLKSKGLPPGTLVSLREGDGDNHKGEIYVYNYDKDNFRCDLVDSFDAGVPDLMDEEVTSWMDVSGLTQASVLKQIGELFDIHPLWLEDILNPDHRPKMEELDHLVFLILKNVRVFSSPENNDLLSVVFAQSSVMLGSNFVLSFHDAQDEAFNQAKERLKKGVGKLRSQGAGYLFYTLIDSIVDNYFFVLEKLGSEIEDLTSEISTGFEARYPLRVMHYKNEILYLKKSAAPLRDSLLQLMKLQNTELVGLGRYLQDALDHATQIVEVTDSYREILEGLLETYRGSVSEKMNEIMKTLTLFTAFFSPLTFVVGVYGMNFQFMPELTWANGYYFSLGLMAAICLCMFVYFKRKSWL